MGERTSSTGLIGQVSEPMAVFLFVYDRWYPEGGADDLLGVFPSAEAAKAAFDGREEVAPGYGCQEAHIAIYGEGTLRVVERFEASYEADEAAERGGHGQWITVGEEGDHAE